jgi:hypothetical protein
MREAVAWVFLWTSWRLHHAVKLKFVMTLIFPILILLRESVFADWDRNWARSTVGEE